MMGNTSSAVSLSGAGMLSNLDFSDLYIRLDHTDRARYRPTDRITNGGNLVVPDEYETDIRLLRERLMIEIASEGSFSYDGMTFRTSRQPMANSEMWVALRRVWTSVPTLEDLHINARLLPPLRALGKRQGLILVAGSTGAGKTTTAISLLTDYLRRYGELAYTIEDPVEYRLHGSHGKSGFCFQIEVSEDEEWAPALKTALRWHPRYIFVGEIRSPQAARQLLRAATSGHLVITTIHAGSVEEAIYAMVQSAHSELGGLTHNLVADALVAVAHQVMTPAGPKISFISTRDHEEGGLGDPIRACIRENKIGMVSTYIHQQAAKLGGAGITVFNPAPHVPEGEARKNVLQEQEEEEGW